MGGLGWSRQWATAAGAGRGRDMRGRAPLKQLLAVLLLIAGCAGNQGSAPPARSGQYGSTDAANSARIHTELGANYYSRRQYEVALDELGLALKAMPSYGPAHNILGLVYMELKEDAKAAQSFEQALRIDPNDSDANNNYGWFICQRGDPAKALPYFDAAQRNPLYSTPERALVNAGICSRKMNDQAGAEKYFRQALTIQPNHGQALYNLADMSYQRGKLEESRTYLGRYMRAVSPTPEALWLGIRTERRLGDRAVAASYASQLCRRFPDSQECQGLKSGAEQ